MGSMLQAGPEPTLAVTCPSFPQLLVPKSLETLFSWYNCLINNYRKQYDFVVVCLQTLCSYNLKQFYKMEAFYFI